MYIVSLNVVTIYPCRQIEISFGISARDEGKFVILIGVAWFFYM